jgi:mevalonate pyrophosphate decarboxylase
MANVFSLRGDAIVQQHEADPDIVEKLERLLEEARSGALRGIAFAIVRDGRFLTSWSYDSSAAVADALGAGVLVLGYRMAAARSPSATED